MYFRSMNKNPNDAKKSQVETRLHFYVFFWENNSGVWETLDRMGICRSRTISNIVNFYVFLRVKMSNVFKVTTLKILRCLLKLRLLYPVGQLLGSIYRVSGPLA
jgi:hypothetical protein